METPNLPLNPFIDEGDAKETCQTIDCVLNLIQQYETGHQAMLQHSNPIEPEYISGLLRVLDGVRDAVQYLGNLDTASNKVSKLEVKS